jgi:hypothetical protein
MLPKKIDLAAQILGLAARCAVRAVAANRTGITFASACCWAAPTSSAAPPSTRGHGAPRAGRRGSVNVGSVCPSWPITDPDQRRARPKSDANVSGSLCGESPFGSGTSPSPLLQLRVRDLDRRRQDPITDIALRVPRAQPTRTRDRVSRARYSCSARREVSLTMSSRLDRCQPSAWASSLNCWARARTSSASCRRSRSNARGLRRRS